MEKLCSNSGMPSLPCDAKPMIEDANVVEASGSASGSGHQTGSPAANMSVLESLLRGRSVEGYEPEKPKSILESLLMGEEVDGYKSSTVANQRRKPMNVTVPIPADPKAAKFPVPACKSGCEPRSAHAAMVAKYYDKCERSWEVSTGAKAKAAAMWEQRVNDGVKNQVRRFTPQQKYMQFNDRSCRVSVAPLPVFCGKKKNEDKKLNPILPEAADIPQTSLICTRVSDVTLAEVVGLRERGRKIGKAIKFPKPKKGVRKSLLQTMGWRFVKDFKEANSGIIQTHAKWREEEKGKQKRNDDDEKFWDTDDESQAADDTGSGDGDDSGDRLGEFLTAPEEEQSARLLQCLGTFVEHALIFPRFLSGVRDVFLSGMCSSTTECTSESESYYLGEVICWLKTLDQNLSDWWQDGEFLSPSNIVFLFLVIKECLKVPPESIASFKRDVMTCFYVALAYQGHEIAYPFKPFLMPSDSKIRFFGRAIAIANICSAKMLEINRNPVVFGSTLSLLLETEHGGDGDETEIMSDSDESEVDDASVREGFGDLSEWGEVLSLYEAYVMLEAYQVAEPLMLIRYHA